MPSTLARSERALPSALKLWRTSAAARDLATAASGALALKNDGGPARSATTASARPPVLLAVAFIASGEAPAPAAQPAAIAFDGSPSATCCQSGSKRWPPPCESRVGARR